MVEEAVTTSGCLDGWEGTTDIGTPFGDGIYKKKTVRDNTKTSPATPAAAPAAICHLRLHSKGVTCLVEYIRTGFVGILLEY